MIGMISAGASAYVPKGDSTDKVFLRTIHRTIDANYIADRAATPADTCPSDAPSPNAAEHRGREGDLGRHRSPPSSNRSRTWRRLLIVVLDAPAARGDPSSPPLRQLACRCRSRRPSARRGDGALPASLSVLSTIPDDLFLEFEVTQSTAATGRFLACHPAAHRFHVFVLGFTPLATSHATALEAVDPEGSPGDPSRAPGLQSRRGTPDLASRASGISAVFTPDLVRLDETLVRTLGQSFSSHSIVAAVAACASEVRRAGRSTGCPPLAGTAARAPEPRCRASPGTDRERTPSRSAELRDEPTMREGALWSSYRAPTPRTTRMRCSSVEHLNPGRWYHVRRWTLRLTLVALVTLALAASRAALRRWPPVPHSTSSAGSMRSSNTGEGPRGD